MNKFKMSILFFICNILLVSIVDGAVMAQLQGVPADKSEQNYLVLPDKSEQGAYYARDPYVSELASLHNTGLIKNFFCLALLPCWLITGFDAFLKNDNDKQSLVCVQSRKDEVANNTGIKTFPENPLHPKTYTHLRDERFDSLSKKQEKPCQGYNISGQKILRIQQPSACSKK